MRKLFLLLLSVLFVVSCSKDAVMYTLTTSANPSEGGTVSPTTKQYEEGETATINATPAAEYLFQSWSGATGSSSSTSLVMSSDKSVTANFVKKKYTLTTTVEGKGTITEKVIKAGAATDYNSGTIVELTATPSTGWKFKEWSGDLTGNENPVQITVNSVKTVKAIFTTNTEGSVQKGPFLSGTKITVYELNQDLSQTGKSFTSEITDNSGAFSINEVNLASDYVRINADGYYFNEVKGKNSGAQLSLSLISEIGGESNVNINIISALERPRVEYLVGKGNSFIDAKKQALVEILKIFEIEESGLSNSEFFDITKEGKGNAILLAISSIIQGFRTDAETSELISNISTDIKEDGTLNSDVTGSKLLSHAKFIQSKSIKNNLKNRYNELGKTINIPEFDLYILKFISDSNFKTNHFPMEYPEDGAFGKNILSLDKDNYVKDDCSESGFGSCFMSMRVNFKEYGNIKIKLSSQNGRWAWDNQTVNATATSYDGITRSQVFTPLKFGNNEIMDVRLQLCDGEFKIEYYEMGSEEITRTRVIKKNYDLENDYVEIKDKNFERILNAIGGSCLEDFNAIDGYYKKSILSLMTELKIEPGSSWSYDLNDAQISDFSGIEHLSSLTKLKLAKNKVVQKIDLSSLTNLSDFDAIECDNLTCIIVSQEQLDKIPTGWQKPTGAEYKLSCD